MDDRSFDAPNLLRHAAGRLHGFPDISEDLLDAADEPDLPQLPTLGQGTWLVCVDRHGELVRCEPHFCFYSFKRLEQPMREGES